MDDANTIINEKSINRLNQIFINHSIEGIVIADKDSSILMVNSAFSKITGYTANEVIGKTPKILKSGKHPKAFHGQIWDFISKYGEWQGEIWNRRKNGEEYPEWLTIRTILNESDQTINYLGIFSDISSLEFSPETILIIDGNGYILYANQQSAEILGVKNKSDLVGLNVIDYMDGSIRELAKERIYFASQGRSNGLFEGKMVRVDGQVRFFESVSVPIIFSGIRYVQVILRDITDLKNAVEQLRQIAYYDQLTQLPNRVSLEKQFSYYISASKQNHQKVAIMYIGLGKVSFITKAYSYSIGDGLIKGSVARIQECLRENDSLFRISEKGFLTVLNYDNNLQIITEIADKIVQAFRSSFIEDGYEFRMYVNIGINAYLDGDFDTESIIKDAYMAYRRAKAFGENTYIVSSPDMNIQTKKTFTLRNDLHKALENGELELYYQPRIDPFTCNIIGAEALLRWNHPTFGVVSPGDFIPLAEESDLILSIGEWVIRRACKHMSGNKGFKTPMPNSTK